MESINQVTKRVLSHYHHHSNKNRPFIVGIDGLGGSGKTTLALNLKQELRIVDHEASILHMDDHIVIKSERYGTGNEEWYEYYVLQWNIELIRTDLFLKLYRNHETIALPFYQSLTDTIVTQPINITPATIILIEGVFLQRKEWRDFFDYMIFIDCSYEVRAERVVGRDVYLGDEQARIDKYKRRYWLAEEHYFLNENPIGQADYIYKA